MADNSEDPFTVTADGEQLTEVVVSDDMPLDDEESVMGDDMDDDVEEYEEEVEAEETEDLSTIVDMSSHSFALHNDSVYCSKVFLYI